MTMARVGSLLLATLVLVYAVLLTAFWCVPIYLLALAKLLLRRPDLQRALTTPMTWCAEGWALCIVVLLDTLLPTRWEIELPERGLSRRGSYLVVANHRSWVDILVVLKALIGRFPFPRFFLKRELLALPLVGVVFWALDYPVMRRYDREHLDLETVRRVCRRYRGRPVAVINFLEGTRHRPDKHRAQDSPYRHLLRPRAGGAAFVLRGMEGKIRRLIDLTIAYPRGEPGFAAYLGGRLPLIRVRVRVEDLPENLLDGDYENDSEFRVRFQEHVRALWSRKDDDLDELLHVPTDGENP
jgi:1-acyl-sn-glycerol-3-phosphate acyltransferase